MKVKKVAAIGLAFTMGMAGVKFVDSYITNENTKQEVNRFVASRFFDSYYRIPDGFKYSDFDTVKNTYYVHRNNNRTIISENEYVKGYECLGVYNSKSSSDTLFYYEIANSDDIVTYETVSYDDIQGKKSPFNVISDLTLIDENAPEDVSAFVPQDSIDDVNSYAKNMG